MGRYAGEMTLDPTLSSFPADGLAVVFGARGGIGAALVAALQASGQFADVFALSRTSEPPFDLESEPSISAVAEQLAGSGVPLRLVMIATGVLAGHGIAPEKSWRNLDGDAMARSFAINAIGPALILKHVLPLLPKDGKSAVIALSARVASIGDNQLGGWYAYRASKAALNQLVHSAAIELARSRPEAICAVLHPGTVATSLSAPFVKSGLDVQVPEVSANRLLSVIDQLTPQETGGFFDHMGAQIPW